MYESSQTIVLFNVKSFITQNPTSSSFPMQYTPEPVYLSHVQQIVFVVLTTKLLSLCSIIYNPSLRFVKKGPYRLRVILLRKQRVKQVGQKVRVLKSVQTKGCHAAVESVMCLVQINISSSCSYCHGVIFLKHTYIFPRENNKMLLLPHHRVCSGSMLVLLMCFHALLISNIIFCSYLIWHTHKYTYASVLSYHSFRSHVLQTWPNYHWWRIRLLNSSGLVCRPCWASFMGMLITHS